MAEERLHITVTDEELDAAIAKLEKAISPIAGGIDIKDILEGGGVDIENLLTEINEADSRVDTVEDKWTILEQEITRYEAELIKLAVFFEKSNIDLAQAQAGVSDLVGDLDEAGLDPTELPYFFYTLRRLTQRIPVMREIVYLMGQMRLLGRIPLAFGGLVALYQIIIGLMAVQKEQQRQLEDTRQAIIQIKGFKTNREFDEWEEQRKADLEQSYRGDVI